MTSHNMLENRTINIFPCLALRRSIWFIFMTGAETFLQVLFAVQVNWNNRLLRCGRDVTRPSQQDNKYFIRMRIH